MRQLKINRKKNHKKFIASFLIAALFLNQAVYAEVAPLQEGPAPVNSIDPELAAQAIVENQTAPIPNPNDIEGPLSQSAAPQGGTHIGNDQPIAEPQLSNVKNALNNHSALLGSTSDGNYDIKRFETRVGLVSYVFVGVYNKQNVLVGLGQYTYNSNPIYNSPDYTNPSSDFIYDAQTGKLFFSGYDQENYNLTIQPIGLDVSQFTAASSNSRYGFRIVSADSQNSYLWMIDFQAYAATGELPVRVGGGSIVRHSPSRFDVSPDGQVVTVSYHESGADFLSGSSYEILMVADLKAGNRNSIGGANNVETQAFAFDADHGRVTVTAKVRNADGTVSIRDFNYYYEKSLDVLQAKRGIPLVIKDLSIVLQQNSLGMYSFRISRINADGSLSFIRSVDMISAGSADGKISYYKSASGREVLILNMVYSSVGLSTSLKVIDVVTGVTAASEGSLSAVSVNHEEINLSVDVAGKPWPQEKRTITAADFSVIRMQAVGLDVSQFTPASSNSRYGFRLVSADSQNSYLWIIDFQVYAATGELPIRVGGGSVIRHSPIRFDVSPDGKTVIVFYHESGADYLAGSGFTIQRMDDLKQGSQQLAKGKNSVHPQSISFEAVTNKAVILTQEKNGRQVLNIWDPVSGTLLEVELKGLSADKVAVNPAFVPGFPDLIKLTYTSGLVVYYDALGRKQRETTDTFQPDGVTLLRRHGVNFNPATGLKINELITDYDANGKITRTYATTYQADGVTLSYVYDVRYTGGGLLITNAIATNYDAQGKKTRDLLVGYQPDGKTFSVVQEIFYNPATGIKTKDGYAYYNTSGQRTRYTSTTYQADGQTLAQTTDTLYTAAGLTMRATLSTFDAQGRKTRETATAYHPDGKTAALIEDSVYNPLLGVKTAEYYTYANAQGQKTRTLSAIFHPDGITWSKMNELLYDAASGKILTGLMITYDAQGRQIRNLSATYHANGITPARSVDIIFDPVTGKVIKQTTTCYSATGTIVVCS